jgi:hypothetical protein
MSAKTPQLTTADRRADREMFDGLVLVLDLIVSGQNPTARAAAQRTKERLQAIAPSMARATPGDAYLYRAIAALTRSLMTSENRSVSAAARRFEARLQSVFPSVDVETAHHPVEDGVPRKEGETR